MRLFPSIVIILPLALALSARAGQPASTDYQISMETADGGGSPGASSDYASDASLSPGNLIASADYTHRGGYIGELPNAPVATNYSITVNTNGVIEVPVAALLSTVSDADGDRVSFVSATGTSARNGAVSVMGRWVVYQPPANYTGSDSIAWVVQSTEGDRSTGIISATVGDPPAPTGPTLNLIALTFDSAPGSTDATLRFASLPGEAYVVQYTDSLAPPVTWTTLGTAATTNGVFQIVDPTAREASQRYYRTILQSQ